MFLIFRLIKLGIVIALIYILYKVLWRGEKLFKSNKSKNPHPQAAVEQMKRDPVCGTFLPADQGIKYKAAKETLYFCSEECKKEFEDSNSNKSS